VVECEACKIAFKLVSDLAGENATEAKINETAYDICNRLAGIQLQQIVRFSMWILI